MNRRTLLASAGLATVGLAGCSSDGATESDGTDTGTSEPTTAAADGALAHLETVYEAWVALDADAFLATLHSTNNHPEEEVRRSADEIEFEGELAALNAEVLEEDLDADAIASFFESGPNVGEDDVDTFTGVRNLTASVDPSVDGEATTEAGAEMKAFLETEKSHFLAVEDGEWRFVL